MTENLTASREYQTRTSVRKFAAAIKSVVILQLIYPVTHKKDQFLSVENHIKQFLDFSDFMEIIFYASKVCVTYLRFSFVVRPYQRTIAWNVDVS